MGTGTQGGDGGLGLWLGLAALRPRLVLPGAHAQRPGGDWGRSLSAGCRSDRPTWRPPEGSALWAGQKRFSGSVTLDERGHIRSQQSSRFHADTFAPVFILKTPNGDTCGCCGRGSWRGASLLRCRSQEVGFTGGGQAPCAPQPPWRLLSAASVPLLLDGHGGLAASAPRPAAAWTPCGSSPRPCAAGCRVCGRRLRCLTRRCDRAHRPQTRRLEAAVTSPECCLRVSHCDF